jgi:hypothetical protein
VRREAGRQAGVPCGGKREDGASRPWWLLPHFGSLPERNNKGRGADGVYKRVCVCAAALRLRVKGRGQACSSSCEEATLGRAEPDKSDCHEPMRNWGRLAVSDKDFLKHTRMEPLLFCRLSWT